MAKRKQKTSRGGSGMAFLITFVVFLLIFGGIMVWAVNEYLDQSKPPEAPAPAPSVTDPPAAPAQIRRLLLITEDGGQARGFVLLSAEAAAGRIRVIPLPRETVTTDRTTQSRLYEVYAAEGVPAVIEQVETLTGLSVDHYAVMTYANVQKLVTYLNDGVIFTLPEAVSYQTADGSTVHMKSGARTLSSTQVTDLFRYTEWHSGRRGQANIQGQLIAALIDQYFVAARFDENDTDFKAIINLTRSDLLVSDFNAARPDLLTLAKHNNRNICVLSYPKGEFVGVGEDMRFEAAEPCL